MIKKYWIVIVLVLSLFPWSALAEDPKLSAVLEGIRKRYGLVPGLALNYEREVITKSMAMLGTQVKPEVATGVIYYKSPHSLKFQQETPTKEILVTDGNVLWWYIQAKNQAHRYSSHQLSRELKLLGDIFQGLRGVEQSFVILQKGEDEKGALILEVTPSPSWGDIDHIDLTITPGSFHIQKVEIYNLLGGLTRFKLGDSVKEERFSADFFKFTPPPGTRVIEE
ncbi:MAG: outer membrane lipoprotein carrier protein LolA [Desulfobacterota bacterium]|jgi:outer membrane lipoprotein carrier protein|nr:outer membrane lipoprotein carrier protein LolA [Thermodesulfobacteriota bacterium]